MSSPRYHPALINMEEFCDIVSARTSVQPENVVEIGCYDGKDALFISRFFGIPRTHVFLFEAHPELFSKLPDVKRFHLAISNVDDDDAIFNAIPLDGHKNHGISSVVARDGVAYDTVPVKMRKFSTQFSELGVSQVDICKIDVEGHTLEVLEGFENRIQDVRVFHLECEHVQIWREQKLYRHVDEFLFDNGFMNVAMKFTNKQSDSVWGAPGLFPQELVARQVRMTVRSFDLPGSVR